MLIKNRVDHPWYWDHNPSDSHVHNYDSSTSVDFGHSHRMEGETLEEMPFNEDHVHYYIGWTTVDDGHSHSYSGFTEPMFRMSGGHIHRLEE